MKGASKAGLTCQRLADRITYLYCLFVKLGIAHTIEMHYSDIRAQADVSLSLNFVSARKIHETKTKKGICGIRNLNSRKSWYLSKFLEQPTAEASKYIKKLSLIKQWDEVKHVNQLDNGNITSSNANIRHTTLSEEANDLELQLELQNETWAGTSRCGK